MNADHRAALLLVGLAVVGQGVRTLVLTPTAAPGSVALLGVQETAPHAQLDSARAAAAPLTPAEKVNLDQAPAREIARIPGIGPGMARRIVEHRQQHGAFGSLERLDSVPGVGPALLAKLAPHAAFDGPQRSGHSAPPPPGAPETGTRIALNSASAHELAALPGLGPAKASAVVAYRELHGSFASVEDLVAVPGIGPATVAKLRSHLNVR